MVEATANSIEDFLVDGLSFKLKRVQVMLPADAASLIILAAQISIAAAELNLSN